MTQRRLAVDAAVVAVLAAATAAYEPLQRLLSTPDAAEISKKLGQAAEFYQLQLVRWWIASAVGVAAMLVRSRFPLVALVGAAGMTMVHASAEFIPVMPVDLAAPIALFTLAAAPGRRWVSYAALGLSLVAAYLVAAVVGPIGWAGGSWVPPAVVALVWLFGDRTRTRRAYLDEVAARARDLERERDQQAELATAAERARIARELHDAVAHGLSVIVIQAQAAAGSMDRRPATARAALAAIVATGRDSLTEMRRLLGLTRPDDQELAPLPGVADLPTLVERIRAAGIPVTLNQTGRPVALPTGVALTVYRITQEALTNALKHASPARARVLVSFGEQGLELEITDDGPGPATERNGAGQGLIGMRERVALHHGSMRTGARPEGGYAVTVRLPYESAR